MQHRADTRIMHEEQILEAIDQLRRRKARPDADRICNYLLRKCSVDARDTITDLHRLIEAEKVIQVDYKGNTSYRNASKWSRLQLYKNRPEGFVKEKLNSSMIAGAVAELVVAEPDYLDQGVPADRLVEQLLNGHANLTPRRMVDDFLNKEVASGNLTRLSNGNYSLVATSEMTRDDLVHGDEELVKEEARLLADDSYEYNECDERDESRSDTPRSSARTSPKEEVKTELDGGDSFEIKIEEPYDVGATFDESRQFRELSDNSTSFQGRIEDDVPATRVVAKEEPSNGQSRFNLKELRKNSKSERKQRLEVRREEPVCLDNELKFDDYTREFKEERDHAADFSEDRDEEDAGRSSTNPSPTPSSNNAASFRSARRKRAKKVFDPSDSHVVRKKRGRQPGQQSKTAPITQEILEIVKPPGKDGPHWHCSLCAKEKQERLVACRDCTVRAHPSCIYSPEELILKLDSSWQCERCKSCSVCCETSDAGQLLTCYSCDEAYHPTCHTPRVTNPKLNSKWHCNNCVQKHCKPPNISSLANRPLTPSNPLTLPPVLSPQVSPIRGSSDQVEDDGPRDGMDPNIPDASDWTSEQVYQYFARLFPKEAEAFRQQDIDGHSLLLMKRSDVLTGMDLLLGPALKIYRHVLKLQVRRDDPRLYWL